MINRSTALKGHAISPIRLTRKSTLMLRKEKADENLQGFLLR